jgi:hypothetical protein
VAVVMVAVVAMRGGRGLRPDEHQRECREQDRGGWTMHDSPFVDRANLGAPRPPRAYDFPNSRPAI